MWLVAVIEWERLDLMQRRFLLRWQRFGLLERPVRPNYTTEFYSKGLSGICCPAGAWAFRQNIQTTSTSSKGFINKIIIPNFQKTAPYKQ